MKTHIKQWGNTLALRIPKTFASKLGFHDGTPVDLKAVDGSLIVRRIDAPDVTLEELLAKVTKENLHNEIEFGPAVGEEAW